MNIPDLVDLDGGVLCDGGRYRVSVGQDALQVSLLAAYWQEGWELTSISDAVDGVVTVTFRPVD